MLAIDTRNDARECCPTYRRCSSIDGRLATIALLPHFLVRVCIPSCLNAGCPARSLGVPQAKRSGRDCKSRPQGLFPCLLDRAWSNGSPLSLLGAVWTLPDSSSRSHANAPAAMQFYGSNKNLVARFLVTCLAVSSILDASLILRR